MKNKKRIAALFAAAAVTAALLAGCAAQSGDSTDESESAGESAAVLVSDIPTVQAFTQDAVSEEDIEAILSAGINAPSALNSQPWHFSVVTNAQVLQMIADDMSQGFPPMGMTAPPDGEDAPRPMPPASSGPKAGIADAPLAIIVSCREGQEFNAGLACQSMYVEAQLLGYGSKIISSPTIALNGEKQAIYREILGIPSDCTAVAVLLVGREDTSVDASSGATERNPMEDTVSFVGE
ncbi:MAG: nitroreductase family protein [Clostridia bacterium]|nr:nitroreductase family protein [Clostridia bacterium]